MPPTPEHQQFLSAPFKTFFSLWLPVLFSMVAEPLTGLVDTAFIARLGADALAALGVGTVVLTSGMWLFNFLSVGSQTEVSQAVGRDDFFKGRRMGSLATLLALLIGLFLTVIFVALAPTLAKLMGASSVIHDHSVTYITIRGFAAPAVLVTMTSFGILYGLADMRSPLFIAVTVNVLNIILDYLFIFGAGPIPPMGIAGAALASSISQWSGAIFAVLVVSKKLGFSLGFTMVDVRRLLSIGHDMVVRTGSLLLFLVLATRSATKLGADSGGAHQAIRQVWVFTALFFDASAVTAQSLIGYFFGSGNIEKARRVAFLVCQWSLLVGVLVLLAQLLTTQFFADQLVPQGGLAIFIPAWYVCAIFQPLAAMAFVTDGIHWGCGDFSFLRNGVLCATLCGSTALLLLGATERVDLTTIWWVTGGWIAIRAILGLLRIWPGIGEAPLKRVGSSTD